MAAQRRRSDGRRRPSRRMHMHWVPRHYARKERRDDIAMDVRGAMTAIHECAPLPLIDDSGNPA